MWLVESTEVYIFLIIITNERIVYSTFWYKLESWEVKFRHTKLNFPRFTKHVFSRWTKLDSNLDMSDYNGSSASDIEKFHGLFLENGSDINVSPISASDTKDF